MAAAILEALEQAKKEDLEAVEVELAALRKKIESLEAVERLLRVRLFGRPTRAVRAPAPPPTPNGDGHAPDPAPAPLGKMAASRLKMAGFLLAAGKASAPSLADHAGIQRNCVHQYLNSPLFRKVGMDWTLTQQGREAAQGAGFPADDAEGED